MLLKRVWRGELGMLRPPHPPCPLSASLLLPYLPLQNRAAREERREGVLVIKLQTFPHLMVLCHVSAFLHSSLALSVSPLKFQFKMLL